MEWNGIQNIPWKIENMEWNKENMEWNMWKKKYGKMNHVWFILTKFINFNQKITFYFYSTVNNNYKINLLNFKKLHQL